MIYTINVVTNTKKGDAYDMVAINKWPIIYKTNKPVNELVKSPEMISQLQSIIKNNITVKNAILYIRGIREDMSWEDHKKPVKEILDYAKENKK